MSIAAKNLYILALEKNPSFKERVYEYRQLDSHTIKMRLVNPRETVIFRYHGAFSWAFMSEDYYKNY